MTFARFVDTAVRVLLALALAGTGVLLMINERVVRLFESVLTTGLISRTFSTEAFLTPLNPEPSITFATRGGWFGIFVTPECSVAFFVGPILIFTAAFILIPRFSPFRVLLAAAASVAIFVVLNEARLLGLAYILSHWGREQFEWWHSLGGSFLMVSGLALVLVLFFAIVIRRQRSATVEPA